MLSWLLKKQVNNFNEPIDIVYLWCDINDEKFKQKKAEVAKKYNIELGANSDCRYINNDELKFSLRSIEKYAPWINKIFIVTDNQTPTWLNLDNPKIRVINQNDILPKEAQPSFNSNSIEHCLANIEELSEYFLYSNDDMLFANSVEPNFFFDEKGNPINRYSKPYSNEAGGYYIQSLKNARILVETEYGVDIPYSSHHNIDAYRKSYLKECYNVFKKEIDKTICSVFRNSENIHRMIYSNFQVAIAGNMKLVYKGCLFKGKDSITLFPQSKNKDGKLKKYRPKLFCINDNEETKDEDRIATRKFLENYFNKKSEYERLV